MEESDYSEWQVVTGKPYNKIRCSKFCDNKILQKYYELREDCKEGGDEDASQTGSQVVNVVTKKMCQCYICQNGSNRKKSPECASSQAQDLVPTNTEHNTSGTMDHSGLQSSQYPAELSTDLISQILENTEDDAKLRVQVIGSSTPLSIHLENKISKVCIKTLK